MIVNNLMDMESEPLSENLFPNGDLLDISKKPKPFKIEDDPPNQLDDHGWLDILGSGELKKKVIKPGQGTDTRPQRNNWVTVNLTGRVQGTEDVVEKYENFKFILGDCEVVQGLDVCLTLMEKGELSEVIIPARLAYGAVGKPANDEFPAAIPPNSSMHYEVEIIEVEDTAEEKSLPYDERLSIGNGKREKGNFWYSRGDYSSAIHCYQRALEFLDEEEEVLDKEPPKVTELLNMRLKVYNNLTAAQMKMEAYEAALKSVSHVLTAEPENVKALFRKGKILGTKGNTDEAIIYLKKALALEPETKIIHQELAKLLNKQKHDVQAEKEMYRKMFPQDPNKKKVNKTSTSKVRLLLQSFGLLLTSVIVVVVGVVIYKHSSH